MTARAGYLWRCHTCGATFTAYAPAERHADTHGGARLEGSFEQPELVPARRPRRRVEDVPTGGRS